MYPFRVVKRALTKVHGNTEAAEARISARVKHFIHLGFTPESPGKGKRISYTFEDVAKWHFALEILEYGIDPTAMQIIINQTWDHVCPKICTEDRKQNTLLIMTPRALSYPGSWASFDWAIIEAGILKTNWHQIRRRMTINLSGLAFDLRIALTEAEAEAAGETVESIFFVPSWAEPPTHSATSDELATMAPTPGQLPPEIGDRALFDDATSSRPVVEAKKAADTGPSPKPFPKRGLRRIIDTSETMEPREVPPVEPRRRNLKI